MHFQFCQIIIFEKTLTRDFSCVNTRLGFDTEILLPNLTETDYNKMNIDESYKSFRKDYLKICYKLKLDGEKYYSDGRVIAKILKLYVKNQHGFAMTKIRPVECIKEKKPDWVEFNLLLDTVDLNDKISHLFVIDFEFDYEYADARHLMYNEIYPSVIEKQKKLNAKERSIFQLSVIF